MELDDQGRLREALQAGRCRGAAGSSAMDSRFRNCTSFPTLGARLVHQVRPSDVDGAARPRWSGKGYAPATREHVRVELSSLFTYVIEKAQGLHRGQSRARRRRRSGHPGATAQVACRRTHVDRAARARCPTGGEAWLPWRSTRACASARLRRPARARTCCSSSRLLCVWYTSSGSTKSRRRCDTCRSQTSSFRTSSSSSGARVQRVALPASERRSMLTQDFPVRCGSSGARSGTRWDRRSATTTAAAHAEEGKGCGFRLSVAPTAARSHVSRSAAAGCGRLWPFRSLSQSRTCAPPSRRTRAEQPGDLRARPALALATARLDDDGEEVRLRARPPLRESACGPEIRAGPFWARNERRRSARRTNQKQRNATEVDTKRP
jgi:hypothetical protein